LQIPQKQFHSFTQQFILFRQGLCGFKENQTKNLSTMKKKHLHLFSAIILVYVLFLQNNILHAQEIKLSQAEIIAYNSQKKITNFTIDQSKEIKEVLKIWEKEFGEIEPILRVKILSDIYNDSYIDDSCKTYTNNYISKYTDRYYASQEENYNTIYIQEKGYFDHVPLMGLFDAWTKATAVKLLSGQEEGSSEYLFCTLFSDDIDGFYDLIYSKKYKQNKVRKTFYKSEIQNENILSFSAGTWIPKGKLSYYFNPSPYLGLKAGYEIYENVRIDFDMNLCIFSDSETFQIEDDSIMNAEGDFYISLGGLFTKEYIFFGDYYLDINAGIAFGILNTDQGYYSYDAEYDTESYVPYNITAGDYSAGFTIRRMLDTRSSFGFNIMYHLTPFKNNRKTATKNIGMNFFTISLLYKF